MSRGRFGSVGSALGLVWFQLYLEIMRTMLRMAKTIVFSDNLQRRKVTTDCPLSKLALIGSLEITGS